MNKKIVMLPLLLTLLLAVAVAAFAGDASLTRSISFDKWMTINLTREGLTVTDIIFKTDTEAKTGRFGLGVTRGPYATFSIVNNSGHDMEYGVAIALFDKNNNLITAADYAQVGKLNPAESKQEDVVFGPVNLRYTEATYFKIVLEAK